MKFSSKLNLLKAIKLLSFCIGFLLRYKASKYLKFSNLCVHLFKTLYSIRFLYQNNKQQFICTSIKPYIPSDLISKQHAAIYVYIYKTLNSIRFLYQNNMLLTYFQCFFFKIPSSLPKHIILSCRPLQGY